MFIFFQLPSWADFVQRSRRLYRSPYCLGTKWAVDLPLFLFSFSSLVFIPVDMLFFLLSCLKSIRILGFFTCGVSFCTLSTVVPSSSNSEDNPVILTLSPTGCHFLPCMSSLDRPSVALSFLFTTGLSVVPGGNFKFLLDTFVP